MNKFIMILFILLILPTSVQAYSYIFENGETANLKVSCFDASDIPCDSSTKCFLTSFLPNSTVFVDNQTMTRTATYYNYSLTPTQTAFNGEYSAVVYCAGTTNDYTSFTYLITPNGEENTTASGILYIGLFSLLVLFLVFGILGAYNHQNIYVKMGLYGLSYLLLIAVVFVGWNMASNFLTSSPFLIDMLFIAFRVLMVLLFPYIISLFVWAIFEIRHVKLVQQLMDKGVPELEAHARVKGKKW